MPVLIFLFLFLPAATGLAQQPLPQGQQGQVRGMLLPAPPGRTEDLPADVVLRTGHGGPITAMAFSPDGRVLVSAAEDGHVIVWDPDEGLEQSRLSGHTGPVRSIALSLDGLVVVSGSGDGTIKIWNREKQSLLRTLSAGEPVHHLAISADSEHLLSAGVRSSGEGSGAVRLWDFTSGDELAVLDRETHGVTNVFFTAQGHAAVASATGDMELRGSLKIFDVPTGKLIKEDSTLVRAATSDGRWIAIQHGQWEDATIAVTDATAGNEVARFPAGSAPVAFSPNGDWVANIAYPNASVVVRKRAAAEVFATIQGRNWEFENLAVSPDASLVATTGRVGGIQLWRTSDGSRFRSLDYRPGSASFTWSRDSKTLITAGSELLYWDIETRKPSRGPEIPLPCLGVALSPDGNLVATGGRRLGVLDRRSGRLVREITGACDVLPLPAFSPNGALIAANCRGVVSAWDLATGNEVLRFGEFDLHDTGVAAFSPDGRFLIASAGPGRASLYKLDGSGAVTHLDLKGGLASVAFSADMRFVALGTRSRMRVETSGVSGPRIRPVAGQRAVIAVYEVTAGRQVFSTPAGDWATALAFGSDGRTLLAASGEWNEAGKVLALERSSGRVLRTLVDKTDGQNWAAFSPNLAWFAASSPRGALKLWRLQ